MGTQVSKQIFAKGLNLFKRKQYYDFIIHISDFFPALLFWQTIYFSFLLFPLQSGSSSSADVVYRTGKFVLVLKAAAGFCFRFFAHCAQYVAGQ